MELLYEIVEVELDYQVVAVEREIQLFLDAELRSRGTLNSSAPEGVESIAEGQGVAQPRGRPLWRDRECLTNSCNELLVPEVVARHLPLVVFQAHLIEFYHHIPNPPALILIALI